MQQKQIIRTPDYRPEVWGPHYWFFLHTVSHTYPQNPNNVTKRKYYELIQNLPLFIPNQKIATFVSELLDRYPVTPYLTSRESFVRWVVFLHNKVNTALGKEEMTVMDATEQYYSAYDAPVIILSRRYGISKDWILTGFICLLAAAAAYQVWTNK
jgi:hypothetical protein